VQILFAKNVDNSYCIFELKNQENQELPKIKGKDL